jgi:histidine triad (HIT) family protein
MSLPFSLPGARALTFPRFRHCLSAARNLGLEGTPMAYDYDDQNVFARILRGEIPSDPLLETEHTLAFGDIRPQAPVHVLVIPKGPYVNFDHFGAEASDAEIADFTRTVARLCADLDVAPGGGGAGYRLIANSGAAGVQEVPHMHVHILGGRVLGRMVPPAP